MKLQSLFVCVVLISSFVLAQEDPAYPVDVVPSANWVTGTIGNGTIYYQTEDFFTFGNIVNPITVEISYSSGWNYVSNVCLNSFAENLPIAGTNLESNCPAGAFGQVSNNTMTNGSAFPTDNVPDGTTDDTNAAEIFIRPGADAGFVVVLPDVEDHQNFTVKFTAKQCADPTTFPVGSQNQCLKIADLDFDDTVVFDIGAGVWQYYRLTFGEYYPSSNNVTIFSNGTTDGIKMAIQDGYLPTSEWAMNTDNQVDGDITGATLLTPGGYNTPSVYYVGIFNSNDAAKRVFVNVTTGPCNSTNVFGYNCQHKLSNTTAVGGIRTIPATISAGNNSLTVNNGSSISFDYSDEDLYSHDYAYFQLIDYPAYNFPYSVRVSVGNNDVSDLSGAPAIFAKLGSYPSAQSADYNISTYGDVTHQLNLPVTAEIYGGGNPDVSSRWFIAVQLPSDFSIWVGTNCANNCSNGEHGDCICSNGDYCTNVAGNGSYSAFYELPKTLQDSAGACSCSKDKYSFSFDCTQKNNGNSALYILLIAIGGLIVLGVAIGVPIYCYIANKKAKVIDDM